MLVNNPRNVVMYTYTQPCIWYALDVLSKVAACVGSCPTFVKVFKLPHDMSATVCHPI